MKRTSLLIVFCILLVALPAGAATFGFDDRDTSPKVGEISLVMEFGPYAIGPVDESPELGTRTGWYAIAGPESEIIVLGDRIAAVEFICLVGDQGICALPTCEFQHTVTEVELVEESPIRGLSWRRYRYDFANSPNGVILKSPPSIEIEGKSYVAGWIVDELTVIQATTVANVLHPDVNGDGKVNVLDLISVRNRLGQSGTAADVNRDGLVNVLDLVTVRSAMAGN